MSETNSTRSGCKDVFNAFLVKDAERAGWLEMPCIAPENQLPDRVVEFSKAVSSKDYDRWVHFYEDDVSFERIWNQPNRYLPILKRYRGVISPDFSLYRDMPLVMQQWNTYRNRAIGHWLQVNNVSVIPNVRFGDSRTYTFCCDGLPRRSVIAIGTHGCIRRRRERDYIQQGLAYVVKTLRPKAIVVYGTAPSAIFDQYREAGIIIRQFDSSFALSRKAVG